jgi:hypothetical protein
MLACLQCRLDKRKGRLDPADDLDHHADLGIIQNLLRIFGEKRGWEARGLAFCRINVRRFAQLYRDAGLATQVIRFLDEELHDTAPNGATADNPHSKLASRHDDSPRLVLLTLFGPLQVAGANPQKGNTYRYFRRSSTIVGDWTSLAARRLTSKQATRRVCRQLHAKHSHGKKPIHLQAHPKIVGGPIEPAFFLSNERSNNK